MCEENVRRERAKRTSEEDVRRERAKRTCEEDVRRERAKKVIRGKNAWVGPGVKGFPGYSGRRGAEQGGKVS